VTTQLECRRLGRTEHRSSIVILGGAMFSAAHPDQVELAFEQAVSAGVNHIDIAPSYGRA
jgi:aryl-alcohol dehydrogenase-like predicted oxidoreductase